MSHRSIAPDSTVAALLVWLGLVALAVGCGPSTFPEAGPTPQPAEPVPAEGAQTAEQFVLGFLEARESGRRDQALAFLSPQAREQFGDAGLVLAEEVDSASLLALEAADADSFEVRVRLELAGGEAYEEYLFVGPGFGPDGETGGLRPWTVRGVQRVESPD